MAYTPGILDAAVTIFALVVLRALASKRSAAPLPPGPRGWPIIGNVLDMPKRSAWEVFSSWGDKFGPSVLSHTQRVERKYEPSNTNDSAGNLVHVSVLGQPIIIISNVKAAVDLLEKKSGIYSDRPHFQMADLTGWNEVLICTDYGNGCRLQRKLLHRVIGSRIHMQNFHGLIENEIHAFTQRLLNAPEKKTDLIKRSTTAISMLMAYGYEIKEHDDPVVSLAEQSVNDLGHLLESGNFLVEIFPWLKYVPAWFPGASFQKTVKEWSNTLKVLQRTPFEFTKAQVAAGNAIPSVVSEYLDKDGPASEDEVAIMRTAANIYGAGSDTVSFPLFPYKHTQLNILYVPHQTTSAISTFFLAMTLFPNIQKRAQAEIDGILGTGRLPTLRDRENLPYIDAVVKEVLRWRPIFPLAVAHRLSSANDDIYDGYLIPKGAIIIPNTWRFMRDPEVYKNPLEFNPLRFLPEDGSEPELNPHGFVFGYGRRICPGAHMADAVLFNTCSMVLALFNISKATDPATGSPIEPSTDYEGEATRRPKEFPCVIKPRSKTAEQLILGN
ncbi:hypothetical protein EW146_g4568 [Bondarzewia mesenterica]|uniref:Cytochrome P450 n=1 Tax=Bondarzewia mesenterica TaxID=1095465 RepID=A0A4S4LZW4_9AGAM|nr:hypothetical protein EW146_g4568 [Bondarzewia mesenterica]